MDGVDHDFRLTFPIDASLWWCHTLFRWEAMTPPASPGDTLMTTATQTTTIVSHTSSLFIAKGTIVGYSFKKPGKAAITGTVELMADCYIQEAKREEDGSWSYTLGAGRTYYCAGGMATVMTAREAVEGAMAEE